MNIINKIKGYLCIIASWFITYIYFPIITFIYSFELDSDELKSEDDDSEEIALKKWLKND